MNIKTKYIKKFIFNKAEYFVGDGNGEEIILSIDYFNNKFKVVEKTKSNGDIKNEAEKIAKDLLKRKHKVNFAE